MNKRRVISVTVILITLGLLSNTYVLEPTHANPLGIESLCGGTVEKKPGESFIVKISFKNKGTTRGSWGVAITFEGDYWTWKGEGRLLTLDPGETKTVTWEGNVPKDAVLDSIARLVVYYDDGFEVLRWWIRVVFDAELSVIYSRVS